MIRFEDIAFGDMLYLVDVNHVGWYAVEACYWDIGIKRVGLIKDESISMDITSQDMHLVQNHIRSAAVPGAIEALEQIASGKVATPYGSRVGNVFEAQEIASAALRAVRGEESA